jgi:Nif-specific regulatory protein
MQHEPVVQDAQMQALHERVSAVATKPISVLITGETGAGKEVLAEVLHRASGRPGPLKVVNCAAIPRELTESILFGHERGAFTGAAVRSRGLFEEAHTGTLLLDEVGELPLDAQVALLRVLQHKRVLRVGSTSEIEVDVRVVGATHRDLQAQVRAGCFRQDLLYRLNAFTLHVPPLRERRQEILPLAHAFLAELTRDWGVPALRLSAEAEEALSSYAWPGNIRQLRNAVEEAAVLCRGPVVELQHLPADVLGPELAGGLPPVLVSESPLPLRERVRRFERQLIADALEQTRGNVSSAARLLRLPVRTLHSKLQSLGMVPPSIARTQSEAGAGPGPGLRFDAE